MDKEYDEYDSFEIAHSSKINKNKGSDQISIVPVPFVQPCEIKELLEDDILTRDEAVNLVRAGLGLNTLKSTNLKKNE